MTQCFLSVHWERKMSHFNLKSWVEFYFRQWVKSLNFWGQIFVSSATQLLRSKWLNFFSRCTERKNWVILTKKVGSNFSSASDSTFKVEMTQFFLIVHWEKKLSHFDLKNWVTWVEPKRFKLAIYCIGYPTDNE